MLKNSNYHILSHYVNSRKGRCDGVLGGLVAEEAEAGGSELRFLLNLA